MLDFTFLTEEQCFDSSKKLEILEKRGVIAPISDFSILLGGMVNNAISYNNSNLLEDRAGYYWTSSSDKDNDVFIVCSDGHEDTYNVYKRMAGARPALPYTLIRSNALNKVRRKDGILEVEYGEYPQKAVSDALQKELNDKFSELTPTSKKYTVDSEKISEFEKGFKPKDLIEYEYKGKKYVRVETNTYFDAEIGLMDGVTLSNGKEYENVDYAWVEVEPIKWLVDEKNVEVIRSFIERLGKDFLALFDSLWTMGNDERLETLISLKQGKAKIKNVK